MNKFIKSSLCLMLFVAADSFVIAQSSEQSYQLIRPAQPTQTDNKIEVVEIFWYGCPHCYSFEPYVEKWLKTKPDYVEFRRMPGIFSKNWMPHAKAYFTAEKMGVLDKIHTPLFEALHKEKKRLYSDKALIDFCAKLGIDKDEFKRIYNSNEVNIKTKQALIMSQRYGISGVPAVIVNGKYRTGGSLAGSYDNVLKVIDQLVDMEKQTLTEN